MNTVFFRRLVILFAALLPAFPALADKPIFFKPPMMGAPATRIGGGTRGISGESVKIQVLAPDQTALTARAAPTLYWYVSGPSSRSVEVSLSLESETEPVVEKKLGPVAAPGIQAIRLAELGVELKPGQEYRWAVALVADAEQRSGDQFASATIRRETPAAPLTDAADLAAAGYWYDALEQLIESKSAQVDELLGQADIHLAGVK
ncbi:MAG TPA: DUF928 domain-containing protein [Methylococcaceae bacterium]|nr:DUF928 domain-containing protein [Methylococcaceae bacterium]